jgi:NAD(P)-dependent dehydrogenase (short-subunit alcohol dehydrogenase family)
VAWACRCLHRWRYRRSRQRDQPRCRSHAARYHGHLAQVASVAGLLVIFDTISYTVTKHVSIGLTEWLAATDVDQGIGVSVLCPAAVRTPILAGKEDTPEGRDARSAPTNSPTWSSRGLQPQPA